jgi:tetratricopeptide (TPR) repeat protein
MVRLEQFRHSLGQVIGETDLQTPLPVRVFVFKNAAGWTTPTPVSEGRDRYSIVLDEKSPISPEIFRALTRLFLHSNSAQMPPAFETGLIEFFSTFDVKGIRITAGTPPAKPDLDWARIHLLMTDPEYFGKLRVLLYNLRHGVADDPAYRNAFGKSAVEIEAATKRHFAAGNFQTTSLPSAPMAAADFPERQISEIDLRLARADLLAGPQSAAEYRKLLTEHEKIPEAEEGLGLIALRAGNKEEAHRNFADAVRAGSTSARAYIEYARLEPDKTKASDALRKAAGINPKLDEPLAMLAAIDTDPRMRIAHLKDATVRNPRNVGYWKALAEANLAEHNYGEAAKAWRGAEQAALDPKVRDEMRAARIAVEQNRLDYEAEERRKEAEEKAREIEKLKGEARAELRKAEAKYSEGQAQPADKVVPWWDGPKPGGSVSGTLKQVDCLGKQARLLIENTDRKMVRLLVADPAKVAFSGSGELTLGCGVQKPRRLTVEYVPKANPKLATIGEVATIEFQ